MQEIEQGSRILLEQLEKEPQMMWVEFCVVVCISVGRTFTHLRSPTVVSLVPSITLTPSPASLGAPDMTLRCSSTSTVVDLHSARTWHVALAALRRQLVMCKARRVERDRAYPGNAKLLYVQLPVGGGS